MILLWSSVPMILPRGTEWAVHPAGSHLPPCKRAQTGLQALPILVRRSSGSVFLHRKPLTYCARLTLGCRVAGHPGSGPFQQPTSAQAEVPKPPQ